MYDPKGLAMNDEAARRSGENGGPEEEAQAWQLNPVSLMGGLGMMAIGAFFAFGAFNYPLGTASRMGPGYFPLALSVAMMVISGLLIYSAFKGSDSMPRVDIRPMVAVLASVATFALGMHWLGLMPAAFLSVLVAALGDRESRIVGTLILAAVVSVGLWGIFLYGLRMPVVAFRMPSL